MYNHTEVLFAAAKSLADEGVANVPKICVSVRMFGEDCDGLAALLKEYRELYEKYPAQCRHRGGSEKPFLAVCSNGGNPEHATRDLAAVTLTAGEHTLTINAAETHSGRWEIWLDALFFEPAE